MHKPLAVLAASLLFFAGVGSLAHARRNDESPKLSQAEHRLVKAVNAYREKKGLAPLSVDPILMREARSSAPHFSHQIGGRWCWHRCRARGFRGWATDDLANGYPSPEDAVRGWATSDGHAMQMKGYFKMNGRWQNYKFNRIGVGVSGRKYIAIFGRDNATTGKRKVSKS